MSGAEQVFQEKSLKSDLGGESDSIESPFEDSISFSTSTSTVSSSSSLDANTMDEDVTSPASASASYGPLYELSELMSQLPIKRGLSKFYQGKSQTFASLASVKSLEDLVKRGRPYPYPFRRRKMKSSKSFGGGLDGHVMYTPKPIIFKKKNSRVSLLLASVCRTTTL